jgi:N-acetylmuramoyl-L-alanine amidase
VAKQGRRRANRALRRRTIGRLVGQFQIGLLVIAAAVAVLLVFAARRSEPPQNTATTVPPTASSTQPATTRTASPEPTHTSGRATPTTEVSRVGILAGHYGPENDPGAVCPDGLREVDINLAVAERVVTALKQWGYETELLEEYDDRLSGYQADALLSIHSDACDIPEASGFKVARVSFSAIPEIEDALVECLYQEYGRITGLSRHDYSITPDMHGYHAFLKIHPETPGAIIEMGFMGADRYILVNHPELLAEGIVQGLLCFLQR